MISINLTQKKFWDNAAEGYIFLMKENLDATTDLASLEKIEKEFYPHVKDILKKHVFSGKKGQSFILTAMNNGKLIQFIFIGVGKLDGAWNNELETLRRSLATGVHLLKKYSIPSAIVALPDEKPFGVSGTELLKQCVVAMHMSDYEFSTFKSDKKTVQNITLLIEIPSNQDKASFEIYLKQGNAIGEAINRARNWADLPGNLMTPTILSEEAKKIADQHKLKLTVFGRDKALELGMGAFCAVDAGSDQDGKFIILEYKTETPNAPTIALCGKGVTFDTGGIGLKPETSMAGMKYDMSGAAAVITAMGVIAQLNPDVNVIALAPAVENMPSGKASRCDDIVKAMNGKTIEIRSTDAEGRLILSDAICYAEKFYKPDVIIDIATLTGAVSYALGHFFSGMMTRDEALSATLYKLGQITGDRVWALPFDDDFKEANRSDVADVGNTGSRAYLAGTITGGLFLENFVDKARWVHLDIAGTAHEVPGINYLGKGATGAGIRLLIEFVMNYKKNS